MRFKSWEVDGICVSAASGVSTMSFAIDASAASPDRSSNALCASSSLMAGE